MVSSPSSWPTWHSLYLRSRNPDYGKSTHLRAFRILLLAVRRVTACYLLSNPPYPSAFPASSFSRGRLSLHLRRSGLLYDVPGSLMYCKQALLTCSDSCSVSTHPICPPNVSKAGPSRYYWWNRGFRCPCSYITCYYRKSMVPGEG